MGMTPAFKVPKAYWESQTVSRLSPTVGSVLWKGEGQESEPLSTACGARVEGDHWVSTPRLEAGAIS